MFDELKELTGQMTQQQTNLKEARAKERLDRFGSIHFKIKDQTLSELDIEVEWNKFTGQEVTASIVKKELNEVLKAFGGK